MGTDGLPVGACFDTASFDLKVAPHCDDLECTAVTIATVDDTGDAGFFPSIAVASDVLPIMSYYDFISGDGNLKVAHCIDAACADATTTPVDTVGNVGTDSSITVGADGLPVISYMDEGNFDLKVAHCDNPECTAVTITRLTLGGSRSDRQKAVADERRGMIRRLIQPAPASGGSRSWPSRPDRRDWPRMPPCGRRRVGRRRAGRSRRSTNRLTGRPRRPAR